MKTIISIIALGGMSCTMTTFYQNGKPVARFQGDMKGMTYHRTAAGDVTWTGDIDHSTPTTAHGTAAKKILMASVPAITASGLPGLIH